LEVALKAVWNDAVIAESDDIVTVEGNAYFPAASLNMDYVKPSEHHTVCPWKGTASYYTLEVGGNRTQMLPGSTPSRRQPRKTLRTASPSGKASRSPNE